MIDRFLAAGSTFDWISPLLAMIQDVVRGPSHTFLVDISQGWSGAEVDRILRRAGCRTWGGMIVDDVIMVTVGMDDATQGQRALLDAGCVPLNAKPGQRQGLLSWLGDLVDL